CANASKRSVALRLSDPAGLEAVLRLADRADVFVQSLRPGLAEARGLGYETLRARNPRLVYCSIGSFGRVGPLRDQPGYDPLMQAVGGIVSVTGEPDRPGVRAGASLVDQSTGLWAALGILAALRERDRIGEGLGLAALAAAPRFAANPARVENRGELVPLLGRRLREETTATWLERLTAAGVPAAPVQDVAEVAEHEQTRALGILQDLGPYA